MEPSTSGVDRGFTVLTPMSISSNVVLVELQVISLATLLVNRRIVSPIAMDRNGSQWIAMDRNGSQ